MAGLTLAQRDFEATQEQLGRWFSDKFRHPATVSLTVANSSGGWSSESLLASVSSAQGAHDYVVRIPPTGGGLFAEYDLEGQARTQELLRGHRRRDALPAVLRTRPWLDRLEIPGDAPHPRSHPR